MALFSASGLNGQMVIIFGGSSGIGFSVARQVVAAGARTLLLVGTTDSKLSEAKSLLESLGETSIQTSNMDMTDEKSMDAFFGELVDHSINHIIVTAGRSVYNGDMIVNNRTVNDLRRQMDAKFFNQVEVVLRGHSKMVDGGSFVLFSGVLAHRPGHGNMSLSVANAAVEAAVRALSNDLGFARGIRINCVSPGMTNTDAYTKMPEEKRVAYQEKCKEKSPLKRIGEPDELAMSVLYCLLNGNVTGQVMINDSGIAMV